MISKNLSFTKTTGEIKMVKKTKQKFYQIPFGRLLNLIEEKLTARSLSWPNQRPQTSADRDLRGRVLILKDKRSDPRDHQ